MNGAAGDYEYDNDVPINSQPNMVISGNSPSLNYKCKLIIINLVFWYSFLTKLLHVQLHCLLAVDQEISSVAF